MPAVGDLQRACHSDERLERPLCLVSDLVTLPLHTSLQTQPQPGPANPPFCHSLDCVEWLRPVHTLLQTQPQPGPAMLALKSLSWSCGGALCVLHCALPCYRPRHIAVTYLVTDPIPAQARDPPFCRSLACVENLRSSWSC